MPVELLHDMKPELTPDEAARQRFVSGLRSFILNDLAGDMRTAFDQRVTPAHVREKGLPPKDGREVHRAMRADPAFKIYSALRVQAQRMVWDSVEAPVVRERAKRKAAAEMAAVRPGELRLNPDLPIPNNVSGLNVHLMPGCYTGGTEVLDAGATYDQGLAVFSMGLMGENLDDIGSSMAAYICRRFPDFQPQRILDLGCTVGHNTLPWKIAFPEAEVCGVDVAAPVLAYASARAKMQELDVDFQQMSADDLNVPDQSVDLVFSSMFLHELSKKTIAKTLAEARRVLRPGGLMLHMELPPNSQVEPFEGFYLDWDCYYNEEPFYKAYRDEEPARLCERAGFQDEDYFQFVTPSLGIYGAEAIEEVVAAEHTLQVNSQTTGRLAEGVTWFGFGAWRR